MSISQKLARWQPSLFASINGGETDKYKDLNTSIIEKCNLIHKLVVKLEIGSY